MFKILCLLAIAVVFVNASDPPIVGGPKTLTGADLEEAKETLRNSLSKLSTGDGPRYRLSKLITATRQTVSGTLYRIHAELVNSNNETKVCNVSIWSQPWLPNGIEVTFECDGENKITKNHNA